MFAEFLMMCYEQQCLEARQVSAAELLAECCRRLAAGSYRCRSNVLFAPSLSLSLSLYLSLSLSLSLSLCDSVSLVLVLPVSPFS